MKLFYSNGLLQFEHDPVEKQLSSVLVIRFQGGEESEKPEAPKVDAAAESQKVRDAEHRSVPAADANRMTMRRGLIM